MREWEVDLYSDTKTRPSQAMRAAMAAAVVGDEQQDEDPTVAALNRRTAKLLGKEAAVFLPSGTMANLISILVHCRRGDEILAEASSHVLHLETGGSAGIAGATVTPLVGSGGMLSAAAFAQAIRSPRRNAPSTRLLWIEQTTNLGGGRVWPIAELEAIRALAEAHGLAVHIDGARLLNAAVAAGLAPSRYGAIADSLWLDFSKGLGAPFGAVLAGSAEFIEQARRFKHMLGGAMRQGGIMAAACLHALDHNVDRLARDHAAAKALASGLETMAGVRVLGPVETNIVIIDTAGTGHSAAAINAAMAGNGIRMGIFGDTRLRAVTHLDLPDDAIERTLQAFASAVR